jgi:hypothetical protein
VSHPARDLARVALLFLVLAIAVTWPLTLHLSTHIIGPFYGDNLEYVWKIWWVKHAVVDLRQSPLVQPDIFYPYGYPLAYGEITPIHTYLGLPLTVMLGPVATYNVFILASFVLSGLFTFLFVRHGTGSSPAGIIAGIIFTFCPYRMARIAGNLPLVDTHWLPLCLLFVERFASRRRWADAACAGLSFAAITLSSWYYMAALGLLLPIYLLARVRRWRDHGRRSWMLGGLAFALVASVSVVPFLVPYLTVQQTGEATVPLEQAAFWSASLTDYLTPNPRHVLWGDWVQEHLTFFIGGLPYEFLLGWGLVSTILALYGWRRGGTREWGWWIVVALLLSLGPVVTLFGRTVTFAAPAGLARLANGALDWLGRHSLVHEPYTLASAGRVAIPLPALLLRWFVPGLAGMRSWGRFAIFATFGIAVLGGIGVSSFLQDEMEMRAARPAVLRRWGVTGLLAGLVFFEFYTGPQQLIQPGPRPVDDWLAAQPERVTIIQLPLAVALSGPQMYYTIHHGQRIASGYGTYLPILFEESYPELEEIASDEALDTMATWGGEGIDLMLIDEGDMPSGDPRWETIAGQSRLKLLTVQGRIRVYRIE